MSEDPSLTEGEIEEQNAALIDLKKQLETLHNTNEQILSLNSLLTEILISCEKFQFTAYSDTSKLVERCGMHGPKAIRDEPFQKQIILQNKACDEVLKSFIDKKVSDSFNRVEVRRIHSAFEDATTLLKYFFTIQNVPTPHITSKTLASLNQPLDPMRFTSLFSFPEDFPSSSDFDKCCAFQLFNSRLESVIADLTAQHSTLLAENDDSATFLTNPQEKTLETYPKFLAIVSLHKKIRTLMNEVRDSCDSTTKHINATLEQMKHKLNSTANFFGTSINEMMDRMKQSRDNYVRACIELSKYRTIHLIREKSDGGILSKHAEAMLKYSDKENAFVESIIDDEKLRKFLEALTNFKMEAEESNQEYRRILNSLEKSTAAKSAEGKKDDKQSKRNLSKIMEEQLVDGFQAFNICFNIAGDMAQQAEEYVNVLKSSGQYYNDPDYIVNEVAKAPSREWMEAVERNIRDNIDAKKKEKERIDEEIEHANHEIDELKGRCEELKKDAVEPKPHPCKDCLKKPKYCICVCGHAFCKKCYKAAVKEGKCPICDSKFTKEDAIQIEW